ncbi:hypothetical protein, partial [Mycobacterium sp.]|uniref:hypothetical protein n=1 Tax=Mycobacterium sp. TaxID=1785 RepID=UPI003C710AB3
MRLSTRQLVVAMLTVALLSTGLGACGGLGTKRATAGNGLVVQANGRVLGRLSLPQLQHLPQVEVVTPQSRGAQVQKGPTVRSILDTAGATGVERVRVEGRDPAQTLTAADLTDQLILNVTKRNTL